ncbi:uncharacterized protein LOC144577746 [Callithrix jacchus]
MEHSSEETQSLSGDNLSPGVPVRIRSDRRDTGQRDRNQEATTGKSRQKKTAEPAQERSGTVTTGARQGWKWTLNTGMRQSTAFEGLCIFSARYHVTSLDGPQPTLWDSWAQQSPGRRNCRGNRPAVPGKSTHFRNKNPWSFRIFFL